MLHSVFMTAKIPLFFLGAIKDQTIVYGYIIFVVTYLIIGVFILYIVAFGLIVG